jgi:hypothetical protein
MMRRKNYTAQSEGFRSSDRCIVRVIDRAEWTLGYSREELLGERIATLIPGRFKKWQHTEFLAEPQLREWAQDSIHSD